jgi:hypothetical protein
MHRAKWNYVVDTLALVAMVVLAVTGFMIRYKLPPGTSRYLALWGMNRHEWGNIHFWSGVVLLVLLALHVILHWDWIVIMTRGPSSEKARLRVGVALVVVFALVAIAAAPFLVPAERIGDPPGEERGMGVARETPPIEGWMTLQEIEDVTGIASDTLVQSLHLPEDVPLDEQIGRLRQQYDFTMSDVREAVREHMERQ